MPRGDGTGPIGMGPISGRAGLCSGFLSQGVRPYAKKNFFCRFGGGFGRRNMFYATGMPGCLRDETKTDSPYFEWESFRKNSMQNYYNWLKRELEETKKRLEDLKVEVEK
ncbi:MAG TPA: DUF5320 domain-containing protein [Victivallales bacterium]|nr:DUF5320 domain-containing protein [Victivallales bacterium]HPO89876.1 DUF5320 domain-containing protein [Victivallales bacterium]HRR29371.1 DUF5320 domain-containing protein [Victivallales bacterium]HRU00500.1 DUF5320 domain-containing protein [Victivallales bacterium]